MKTKSSIKWKTAKNMRPGDRFIMGGHASFMIMSDVKQTSYICTQRLAISENGLAEWIDINKPTKFMVMDVAKRITISATSELRTKMFANIKHRA